MISETISIINSHVSECSIGVTDIAEKTSDLVSLTQQTYTRATNCKTTANKLREITSRFHSSLLVII